MPCDRMVQKSVGPRFGLPNLAQRGPHVAA